MLCLLPSLGCMFCLPTWESKICINIYFMCIFYFLLPSLVYIFALEVRRATPFAPHTCEANISNFITICSFLPLF